MNLQRGTWKIPPLSLNGTSAWRSGFSSKLYHSSRLKCASSPGPNFFPDLRRGFHSLRNCACLAKGICHHPGLVEDPQLQCRLLRRLFLPSLAMTLHLTGPKFKHCLSFTHSTCLPLPVIKVNSLPSSFLRCSGVINLTYKWKGAQTINVNQ